ncbi:MAG: molybdopterin converting factor subunit 1 [Pigmentiphaga sp.]|nr:molybdopterin converting factor subunit 1 [Pigmentiphaga sp.]
MKVQVLYFASLREKLGCASETVELPDHVVSLGALREWLAERGGVWAEALGAAKALRGAINQAMAKPDAPLAEGAEVAFFPPVTGG